MASRRVGYLWGSALILLLVFIPARACTIFVLTDADHAFFCNNEDNANPRTIIWFQPGGSGHYGAVYVGTDTGWAQGGMNIEGLAFDWIAGYSEKWEASAAARVRGNPSQRMLETCRTVGEAAAFFQSHWEPSFSFARLLVADRSGASAVIRAQDNRLVIERDNQCRGFGFGQRPLDLALARHPQPTVENGLKILRDCRQDGYFSSKYSNVYDLKRGKIFLCFLPPGDDTVELDLPVELEKGAHYYDMPRIREQRRQSPLALPLNLRRFPLDNLPPIADPEPPVTAHLREVIQHGLDGTSQAGDFTPEMWKRISHLPKKSQDDLKRFGQLLSMDLVERSEKDGQRSYYYRAEFTHATALQYILLDAQNRVASGNLQVDSVWKPE
ncbi:MAG TPA: hypothetical protein VFB27_10230 [Opitutaceae bacterium]|nr:hypothetical protein [Opitutaceae bacterium]